MALFNDIKVLFNDLFTIFNAGGASYRKKQVVFNFNDGTHDYDFFLVQSISDPKEADKDTIIPGIRADGVIVIPGEKKNQVIKLSGILVNNDGFSGLSNDIEILKRQVTKNIATLTQKYWTGSEWQVVWAYTVKRVEEINFPSEGLRINYQKYEVSFLVVSY